MDSIQVREEHWVIADLKGKAGHIRTVPIPQWVKAAVDVWSTAAGITEGTVFRSINKSGSVWGDGMTPKVLWEVVKEAAIRYFDSASISLWIADASDPNLTQIKASKRANPIKGPGDSWKWRSAGHSMPRRFATATGPPPHQLETKAGNKRSRIQRISRIRVRFLSSSARRKSAQFSDPVAWSRPGIPNCTQRAAA
jgi:hypothetical protein